MVKRYLNRVSGPLMDRIDLHVEVTPVSYDELSGQSEEEGSAAIRKRVLEARELQRLRFSSTHGAATNCNAEMSSKQVRTFCALEASGKALLKSATEKLGLSARAYDRILKVARTIADLERTTSIHPRHIAEAIQYRSLDRR